MCEAICGTEGASYGDREGFAGSAFAGRDPKDVFNKDGLVDELKKALSERILTPRSTSISSRERRGQAQSPERLFEEVGSHRDLKDDPGGSARPGWDV